MKMWSANSYVLKTWTVLACMVIFATISAAESREYTIYCNERFGFCVDYYLDFKTETSPENGDGIQLYDDHGLMMIASGINNATGNTLSTEMADQGISFDSIIYRKKGENWFVLSGFKGSNIVYLKTFVGSGSINHLYIQYPVDRKNDYDGIVSHLSHSFKPGDLTEFH